MATAAIDCSALQELAERAHQRAVRARLHAAYAREQARRDAGKGDGYAERIHLREARAHECAARVTEQTAALYRRQIRSFSQKPITAGRSAEV